MRAFYHPDQANHAPLQYMRFGRVVPPKDLPARTEALLGALRRHGLTPERPPEAGMDPVLAVHSAGFADFLRDAWDQWQALPDERGPEVWPATFPYWSGRPDEDSRPAPRPQGFLGQLGWYLGDMSVPLGRDSWTSILRSADTAVAGAEALIGGGRLAYALCRPSGHHARTDRASGFCYLNNAAIAAQHLRGQFDRVAILDLDTHHGDGTQQIFYRRPDVLTVSVHADPANFYPWYTGYADERGDGPGEGFNLNLPVPHGTGLPETLAAAHAGLAAIGDFGAQALVVALGFDSHRDDPIGVLDLGAGDFGALGEAVASAGLPVLIVQEGGYAIDAIGDCLDAFLTGVRG